MSLIARVLTRYARSNRTLTTSVRLWEEHGDGKTTVTILNEESKDILMVNAYSEAGFRLNNGFFVFGPMVLFPKSVLQWNVDDCDDVTIASLSLVAALDPKPDILVVGVGAHGNKVDPEVIRFCLKRKLNVEILPTFQACATFNFLNAERRYVVGALIPPTLSKGAVDLISIERKKLHGDKTYMPEIV